jgi:hypothetical protein
MMRINGTGKFALFLGLIGVLWACSGFAPTAERSMQKLHNTIEVAYIAGAVIALWFGGEPIGTLQPISLRPIYTSAASYSWSPPSVPCSPLDQRRGGGGLRPNPLFRGQQHLL